jgi:SOS-response transcriptional repressor LexA
MSTWKTLTQKVIVTQDHKPLSLVRPVNVTEELRRLREHAKLSQTKLALKLGYKTQSGYQRYENATLFDKPYLPPEFVEKLIPILVGLGDPPIALEDVLRLAGLSTVEDKYLSSLPIVSGAAEKAPHWIPVLQWEQVKMWIDGLLKQSDIKKYTDASHDSPGPKTFVLPVRDNSMEPDDIKTGDKIVCDPSKSYTPGDIVLAEIDSEPEPVMGRYYSRKDGKGGETIEITPSNVAYPPHKIDKEHSGRIIGPIAELRKSLLTRRR